jgi:hypothetical protein
MLDVNAQPYNLTDRQATWRQLLWLEEVQASRDIRR